MVVLFQMVASFIGYSQVILTLRYVYVVEREDEMAVDRVDSVIPIICEYYGVYD